MGKCGSGYPAVLSGAFLLSLSLLVPAVTLLSAASSGTVTPWYIRAFRDALIQVRRHPRLVHLHISSNFPWMLYIHEQYLGWFTSESSASTWVMRSMLVVAWLSAEPASREIRARRRSSVGSKVVIQGWETWH